MERVGVRQTKTERSKDEWMFSLQDFVSAAHWSYSLFGKLSAFSAASFPFVILTQLFCLHPFFLSSALSSIRSILSSAPNGLVFFTSIYVSLITSTLCLRLLSMACTCSFPPLITSFCFPRMHLFKACFTQTVLK